MVKVVFTADTHLGFDQPLRGAAAPHRRGPDFFSNFRRVLDHAVEQRADLVLHGGDLFHRSHVPEPVLQACYGLLHDVAAQGIPLGIIAGNHERSSLPTSLLMHHPNIHVFHRAAAHVFATAHGSVEVVGIPFARDVDVTLQAARALAAGERRADVRVLLVHQAVDGATVGPSDYVFRAGSDVLARDALPDGLDAYLSGHIHRRQVLWRQRDDGTRVPWIYPGSTERTSFAERSETKGFMVLRFGEPGGNNIHFEPLPARPMIDVVAADAVQVGDVAAAVTGRLRGADPRSVVRLQVPEALWGRCSRRALGSALLPSMPLVVRPLRGDLPGASDEEESLAQ